MKNEMLIDKMEKSLVTFFPNKKVLLIKKRGEWIRLIYEVVFTDGTTVFYKIVTNPEWSDNGHEVNVVRIFKENGIPAPDILVADPTCEIIPYPYIVQEKIGGNKLGNILEEVDEKDQQLIYEAIGQTYKKMHSVKNNESGLWRSDNPYLVRYPVSPNDYMFKTEIVEDSGKKAVEIGLISKELHERIIQIWQDNLSFLKNHQPSMIHVSPFFWNIYVDKKNDQWEVVKLMSLGDVLWWDPAYDLATIKYPPFGEYNELHWNAFLKGYGVVPDEKRLLLYALLHRLCASMGVYMEPEKYQNQKWINDCSKVLEQYLRKLREIDNVNQEIESK